MVMVDPDGHGRSSCPVCRAVFRGGFQRCPRDGAELSGADLDPLLGTVLAERYQIESVIGEGGIGRVYRARHVRMSRRYAIKVPFGELAYDAKVRARFLQEAEATSRLQHPNVIGVVDVGESAEGLLYMAMDLAEGESLCEVIARGPVPRARALAIVAQIAEGLGHAHQRGLVHRDLKPENIILEPDPAGGDRVRIVDFGIAILRDADGNSGRLTTEGIVLGTPHYMSPEQACDQEIDHRTDLFSLGLILYEMLAGVLPFDGSPVEVARKNLGADPPRITQRVPGLVTDRFLEALAFRLLEKRPSDRPESAAEVARLVRLIEGDAGAAATALRLGEVEEVDEQGLAPKPELRPRAPLPPRIAPPMLPEQAEVDVPVIERDDRRDQRRLVIALAAVVAAALLVVVVAMLAGGDDEARPPAAAAPADAAPAVVEAIPPDAGVAVVVDAAVEVVAVEVAVDAGPRRKDPVGKKKRDAGVARVVVDAAPAADEPPSQATLTRLYDRVGRQLDQLIAAQGEAAALAFKKRYREIPYLEAIRKPGMRAEAMAELRALEREISRAN